MIAVVVPNWNGADRLEAAVRSLAAQTVEGHAVEIVVVDNASEDESLAVVERLVAELAPARIVVLQNDSNLGFAGGVNRGIEHALAEGAWAVALFNNDAVAAADWLERLASSLRERPEYSIATSRLLLTDGNVDSTGDFMSEWGVPYPRDRDQPAEPVRPSGEVMGASGGASLYRAALFGAVGLFDQRYFAYLEDVDLSLRARLAGHRAWYCADAVAYHDQGSTSRTIPGFGARQYFRNLPLVLVKNLPARLWPRVLPRFALLYTAMLLNQVRRGNGRAAVSGMVRSWGLVPHGLRERRCVQRERVLRGAHERSLLTDGLPPNVRMPARFRPSGGTGS